MDNRGFIWGIPIAYWIIATVFGLGAASYVGAFGQAKIGESCLVPPRPCEYGTACVSGVCAPTVSGWLDRIIGAFSLQKLLCSSAGILGQPFCQITIPLICSIILILVFSIIAIIVFPNKFALYIAVLLGLVFGIGLSAFVSLYYEFIIFFGAIIATLGYWFLNK